MRSFILCGFLFGILCSSFAQKPIISSVSNNSNVCDSTAITLSVDAISPNQLPVSFQWFRDGNPIANANTRTYTISLFTVLQEGQYAVRVTNDSGSVLSNNIILRLAKKPTIQFDVSAVVKCESATNIFSANANDNLGGPLSYQWQKNNVSISGANSNSYTIPNIRISDAGSYRVLITNQCGTSQSESKQLTVRDLPVITVQPVSTGVCVGGSLQLTSSVTDADTYRWLRDGNVVNSNSSQFSINAVAVSDAGNYVLEASNACGTRTSNTAAVTVSQRPTIVSVNQTFSGDRLCVNQPLTLSVTVNDNQSAITQYQWKKDGVAINGATGSTYQITRVTTSDNGIYSVDVTNSCGTTQSSVQGKITQVQVGAAPQLSLQNNLNSPIQLCEGGSATIGIDVIANNGGVPQLSWKQGGVLIPGLTSSTRVIASVSKTDKGIYVVEASNSCGVTPLSFEIVVKEKPVITVQPVSRQELCVGQPLELRVEATTNNTDVLTYQWYKGGQAINGATSAVYAVGNVNSSHAGEYSVEVQNSCGFSVTSVLGVVVVGSIPTITVAPTSQTLCEGGSARFVVVANANDGGTLQYQWTYLSNPIPGATSNEYVISNVTPNQAGVNSYSVQVQNRCGLSAVINPVSLTVNSKPTVSLSSNQAALCEQTGAVSFSTVMDGNPSVLVWKRNNTQVVAYNNLSTVVINSPKLSDQGDYLVEATNTCGTSISNVVTFNVNTRPNITTEPRSVQACTGNQAVFEVGYTSSLPNASFVWSTTATANIATQPNSARLVIASVAANNAGSYSVIVRNACGADTSATVVLSVDPILSNNVTITSNRSVVCAGNGVQLTTLVGGGISSNLSYLWFENGSLVPSANTPSLSVAALSAAKNYQVEVRSTCGEVVRTAPLEIGVYAKPTFTVSPVDRLVCVGTNTQLSATYGAQGSGVLNSPQVTWLLNGQQVVANTIVNTASTTTYSINGMQERNAGRYQVSVTDGCGVTALSSLGEISILAAPQIQQQPIDVTTCVNSSVSFSAKAINPYSSNATINYQWIRNSTSNLPGQTKDVLSLSGINTGQTGTYVLRAENQCGFVLSNPASLTVQSAPVLVSKTADFILCANITSQKTIEVVGTSATGEVPSVLWSTDNGLIRSFNGNQITVGNTTSDAIYKFQLNNACGKVDGVVNVYSENSTPVIESLQIDKATVVCEGNQLNLVTKVSGVRKQDYLDYVWKKGGGGTIIQSSAHNQKNLSTYLVPRITINESDIYTVEVRSVCSVSPVSQSINVVVNPTPTPSYDIVSSNNQCLSGNRFSFTNRTQISGGAQAVLYTWDLGDGSFSQNQNIVDYTYNTPGIKTVQLKATTSIGCSATFDRTITVQGSPAISKQPIGGVVCESASRTLEVEVETNGATSLTYQWFKDNQPIGGNSNTSSYVITNMSAVQAGSYKVIIKNNQCVSEIPSTPIDIIFNETPKTSFITNKSKSVCLDDATYSFTNTTPDIQGVNYLWKISDGKTASTKDLTHTFTSAGRFSVSLTATAGTCSKEFSWVSEADLIKISTKPIIKTDLPNRTKVKKGDNASLQIEVESFNASLQQNGPLQYLWYKNGTVYTQASNANPLNISNITKLDEGKYRVSVSNTCGTANSVETDLILMDVPLILEEPQAKSVCIGGTMQIATKATSNDDTNPVFEWYFQRSSADLPTLVNSTIGDVLTLSNFASENVGFYFAKVINSVGNTLSRTVFVGDETLPSINSVTINQDITNAVCTGTTFDVLVDAGSKRGTPISYAWTRNSVTIGGETSSRLIVPSLQTIHAGIYELVLTNLCGTINQNIGTVNIKTAPVITSYPIGDSVCLGRSVDFTPTLQTQEDNQVLTYQWYKNGLPYNASGQQQGLRLEILSVRDTDGGNYSLNATNSCGTTIGSPIPLVVITRPTIVRAPIVNKSICVGSSLSLTPEITSVDPLLSYRWSKNSQFDPSNTRLQLSLSNASRVDSGIYTIEVSNRCGLTDQYAFADIRIIDKPNLKVPVTDQVVCEGVSLTRDLANDISYAEAVNTTYLWRFNNQYIPSQTNSALVLPNVSMLQQGTYGVLVRNSCGSQDFDVFQLNVLTKPQIVNQPVGAVVCEKAPFEFMVQASASNLSAITYQWYRNGNTISGASSERLTIPAVEPSLHDGAYYVGITNVCGTTNTSVARLTVRPTPKMLINPMTSLSQCLQGNNVRLSATNLSSTVLPLNTMWDLGDGSYQYGLNANYAYQYANDFTVRLISTTQFGCRDTATTNVTISDQPLIIEQPKNNIVCLNGQASFSVNVKTRANEVINYQWFFQDRPINGISNPSYTISNSQKNAEGIYKVRIQNACNTVFSDEVNLRVAEKPLIITPFDEEKVCLDFRYVFKPEIYSLLPLTYTWYKNGAPMPTGLRDLDSVLINRFQISDVASYKLIVSNRCGVTESFDKKLVAKDKPQVNHSVIVDTICFNTPVQLKLNNPIVSADSVRYEWYKDAFELKEYGRTYQVPSFKEVNSGAYLVRLANQCGSTDIPVANLTLNRPKADFSADTVDACKGQLGVTVNGRASGFFAVDQYRWDIDGNRNILRNVSNGSHRFTQPGRVVIRYSYIDTKGCASDTVEKRFTNYGTPVPKLEVRDTCFNSPVQLLNQSGFGFGSTKFLRTIWDLGDTTIVRNNDTLDLAYLYKRAGLKTIKLTTFTDSSCVPGIISKDVMIFGNPTAVIAVQDSCKGFPVYFTSRSNSIYTPDSVGRYQWNFDDGGASVLKNPVHIFQNYGGHKIQLRVFSDRCPTLFHDTSMLLSIKIPRLDSVYSIVRAIKNESTSLAAINKGRSYLWSPGLGLNNVRIQQPWFRGQEGKFVYTVTITDSAGCINKDTQEVWAFPEPNIYLASAFSPNGDNINETYKPEYIGIQYIEYFKVHDKNNRLIYSTNSMQDSWDGKYQGNALVADAFIVSVSGIDMSGKRIQRQQVIILIR